jgi:phenylacetate-coenzyme A ligase PaaK-like adenylate-forming protein
VIGPGVSCECQEERAGSHINEDHFFPEIVDPDTCEPLSEGTEGVLVFTTLTKEAMPLVRAEVTEDFFRVCRVRLLSAEAIDGDAALRGVRDRVSHLIKDTIGCTTRVTLTVPGSLPRSEGGKLARVSDTRPH